MDASEKNIRVIIVDDYDIVRKGLKVLLEKFDDIEILADVGSGKDAYELCRKSCPDVVLMDIKLPDMDGVVTTNLICQTCPNTAVIALTSFINEDIIQDMLKAGAISYLMKDITGDELVNAIQRAVKGETTLAQPATEMLIHATVKPPSIGYDLTKREKDVLALMVEGLHNWEIAEQLDISDSTAKNHVSNILSKLHTKSRTGAVAIAIEHQLLD